MPAPWTNFLEPNILKQPSFLLDGLTRPSSFLPQCELMHCILGFLVYFSYLQLIRGYSCHFYTKQKKKKPAFFFLHHSTTIPRKQSTTPVLLLTLPMGALLPLILPLSLIWLQTCMITAEDLEWKSATATHTNQTDGSIIIEGACGYGDLHKASYGKYSAGLSTMLFNRGSACGACYEVRCVDHILWCLPGSPSVILTATDFCPPNYGLSADYGGWCNFPKEHFEMSEAAFAEIAEKRADIVPVQYRRVKCERRGGLRFTVSGSSHFYQVLVTNVGLDGEVIAVKVKGSRTGWIPMARNWGQNWQCNVNLIGQPLSFEVTTGGRRTLTSYNVAPANWQFGQTYEGKQF